MPVLLLERLPLPSLEAYAVVSVSLFGYSLHYAAGKTLDPSWRMQFVDSKNTSQELPGSLQTYISTILSRYWLSSRAQDIISFSLQDSLCIWVRIHSIGCFSKNHYTNLFNSLSSFRLLSTWLTVCLYFLGIGFRNKCLVN